MSQMVSSFTNPSAVSKKSHLLTLPPELRNYIYELTFASDVDATVDLLKPTPPSNALVRTCRKICAETRLMYRSFYRKFWQESTFEIVFEVEQSRSGDYRNLRTKVLQLKTIDLANITKIKVGRGGDWCILEDGVWVAYKDLGDESMSIVRMMAPKKYVEDLTKGGFKCVLNDVFGVVRFWAVNQLDAAAETKEAMKLLKGRKTTAEDLLSAIKYSGNYEAWE